jgi:hypothetical protein
MAIPTGTKFHGVAPEVSTKNLGSTQANAMRDVYTIEEIRTSAGTDSVYDNLVAQGTDETTTLVLGYGVSIITTSTPTDFAAKLPQPITGRSTRVVNTSGFPVYVYPSNIGGQINNLPIDTTCTCTRRWKPLYICLYREPITGSVVSTATYKYNLSVGYIGG